MSTKLHIHQLLENIKSGVPKELDLVIDGGAFNGFYTLGALMYLKEMEKKICVKLLGSLVVVSEVYWVRFT